MDRPGIGDVGEKVAFEYDGKGGVTGRCGELGIVETLWSWADRPRWKGSEKVKGTKLWRMEDNR